MRFVRSFMNRIIACEFASPDLEFVWQDAREQDPAQAAQVDVAYVGAGILTVDGVRANLGLAPLASSRGAANAASSLALQGEGKGEGSQKKTLSGPLRKADDDEDSEDDDSNSDSGDESDESDFDAAHPRWAAGSPGGIGGEFAPKDWGDAANCRRCSTS